MINAKEFENLEELESSDWLKQLNEKMSMDIWPDECRRCAQTEDVMKDSIRIKSIKRHKMLYPKNKKYLVVGGVLDNICNSACQSCNSTLSTKIGSLKSKKYLRINNLRNFWKLPHDRIVEVDINGGEPTASKNYREMLDSLRDTVRIVRINTNGSRIIPEIEQLLKQKTMVILTMSFDGVNDVHDYVRWPIKFKNFKKTLEHYKVLSKQYKLFKLNFWTTVSALNICDFENIKGFAKENQIDHNWAFLNTPTALDVKYKNKFTNKAKSILQDKEILKRVATAKNNQGLLDLYIMKQDYLRKIHIEDYFKSDLNLS
jgi:MoaA/NifB/PqqE/SkfB family radical SAM enzyme